MRRVAPPALARTALGVGLRPVHYASLFAEWPALDYFEIISENFLAPTPLALARLDRVRERYPIVLHGIGLNLLGHAPLDEAYLDAVARLADRVDAPFVTDHLCWTGAHGVSHHDLLPTPYTDDLVDLAATRARRVQERLGRPFGLENLSSYVTFEASTMSEAEFYARVVTEAGCGYMLDLNNIYVSSVNHGFDPHAYVDALDLSNVQQVHLAGHTRQPDGLVVDTHDQAVCDEVWELYAYAWRRGGPFPTLIEWDAKIPPLAELLATVDRAREVRA